MAIYKNREVTFLAPVRLSHAVEQVTVIYKDQTHENVPLSQVKFTEDEKKSLQKSYPSVYDDVQTVSEDDLKAVRVGVAPSSDPSYKEAADAKVQHDAQVEANKKQVEAANAEAKKNLDKKIEGKK